MTVFLRGQNRRFKVVQTKRLLCLLTMLVSCAPGHLRSQRQDGEWQDTEHWNTILGKSQRNANVKARQDWKLNMDQELTL